MPSLAYKKALLFICMFIIPLFLVSGRAQALVTSQTHIVTSTTATPSAFRGRCAAGSNLPVDFSVRASDVSLDLNAGILRYNISLEWQRCPFSAETRAYAIYSDPQICPVSGYYSRSPTNPYGVTTDCVKYIGWNPVFGPYVGDGNGLTCWGGTNEGCVTSNFSGARRAEQQPTSAVNSITIPMTSPNPYGWGFAQDTGEWSESHDICQFYKQGVNFGVMPGIPRCENVTVGARWTVLKDFQLSPSASVNLDNDEQPNTATFGGVITNNKAIEIKNATISRNYYIQRANGTTTPIGSNSSVNTISSSGYVLPSIQVGISSNNLSTGDKVCETVSINYGTGKVRADNGTIYGPTSPAVSPLACKPIVNKPYVSFYGGDVNTCGAIDTFYNTGGFGSGVQYAAQAFGNISQFSSARLTGIGTGPKVLSFANNDTGKQYGGAFGAGGCTAQRDYFTGKPAESLNPGSVNVGDLSDGKVSYKGNVSLQGKIQSGRRTALYIEGDLNITGNIEYADPNWATFANIPSLHVYVKGNIYVQPGVSTLTGFYVAQKDTAGAKGIIDTCANGFISYTNLSEIWNNCKSTLSIRGAFASKQTLFRRGNNSLRNANTPDEKKSYLFSNAAERFYIGPEMYLVGPDTTSTGGTGGSGGYQYETVLPPLL
jgi:hypothetical protein